MPAFHCSGFLQATVILRNAFAQDGIAVVAKVDPSELEQTDTVDEKLIHAILRQARHGIVDPLVEKCNHLLWLRCIDNTFDHAEYITFGRLSILQVGIVMVS